MLILLASIAIVWCVTLRKCHPSEWKVLPAYSFDTLNYAAVAKAASEGQYLPFFPKYNRYLNAPFGASWNDFPVTEDILWAATGLLARVFGLFEGLNLSFLLACELAALSFYWVCRRMRLDWEWSLAGALAFGLSPYAFTRGIAHLSLTYYWHLPLCLLVTWWAASRPGLRFGDRKFRLALLVAVITGWQSPYYTNWFLQLLILGALAHAATMHPPWKRLLPVACIGGVTMLAFLSVNLDTFLYQMQFGPNPAAVTRTYKDLEMFALRPVELFLPPYHRWTSFSQLTEGYKSDLAMPVNEITYLGIIGAVGFLTMGVHGVQNLLVAKARDARLALQASWLMLGSVVGGLNGMIGITGFLLFRAQNRVSIFLLALSLIFVVRGLSSLTRSWPCVAKAAAAMCLASVVIWDQSPSVYGGAVFEATQKRMESDRKFTRRLEKDLPPDAMVFQLPVFGYPEAGHVLGRDLSYDHFRPYLFSKSLRFSFGTDKGRNDIVWQLRIEKLNPPDMIAALEKHGFAAVCIVRNGFPDKARQLEAAFQAEGKKIVNSAEHDFSYIVLNPSSQPIVPDQHSPLK